MDKEPAQPTPEWEKLPEWPELRGIIEEQIALHADRHPGIIAEAMVDAVLRRFRVDPRESASRERRKNHPERIRRISHAAFRALDETEGLNPVERISLDVLKSFILSQREEREFPDEDAGP